jgi:hypothetical protein
VREHLERLNVDVAPYKTIKVQLTAAKNDLRVVRKNFVTLLEEAQSEMDATAAELLVLTILKGDLRRELTQRVQAHRQEVVSAVENWWTKYSLTLPSIALERETSKARLDGLLERLGYG